MIQFLCFVFQIRHKNKLKETHKRTNGNTYDDLIKQFNQPQTQDFSIIQACKVEKSINEYFYTQSKKKNHQATGTGEA